MRIVKAFIAAAKHGVKRILWILNGYFGRTISLGSPRPVTVLITYFNPVRMKNINHQIRNILKCSFVERLVISNHNPNLDIQDLINIRDSRITVVNQPVERGCGYRWQVASQFKLDYLVVVDDDFLLSSGQLARLVRYLLEQPEIPHGLSGINYLSNGAFEFRDREDANVNFLCEIYAITDQHLKRYHEITSLLSASDEIMDTVNAMADFTVISQTGPFKPRIHSVGRLFRDRSFTSDTVAIHKSESFEHRVLRVIAELARHQILH